MARKSREQWKSETLLLRKLLKDSKKKENELLKLEEQVYILKENLAWYITLDEVNDLIQSINEEYE